MAQVQAMFANSSDTAASRLMRNPNLLMRENIRLLMDWVNQWNAQLKTGEARHTSRIGFRASSSMSGVFGRASRPSQVSQKVYCRFNALAAWIGLALRKFSNNLRA